MVIAIHFDAASLSRIRLAMSPTFEAMVLLSLRPSGWVHPVLGDVSDGAREAMRYPDVRLLAELVSVYPLYLPDFLTPKPTLGRPAEVLRNQIDAVAETPHEIVAENLAYAATTGIQLSPAVGHAAEDGTLTRRAANGLTQFWRSAVAARWPELRQVLERDLNNRARMLADGGMARVLRTLHPRLRFDGSTMRIGTTGDEMPQPAAEELVLTPSVLGWPHLFGQVVDPANSVVCYPAGRIGTAVGAPPGPGGPRGQALDDLLGRSRAVVLLDLDLPRTTGQLSRRHQLAPATVSYHLGALVNAGLVLRKREGRQVLYGRSEYGDLLLEAVFGIAS